MKTLDREERFGKGSEMDFLRKERRNLVRQEPGRLPGGPVVKTPPCNAGNAHSIPGWGSKIPHAEGQLSPCSTTTEFVLESLCSAARGLCPTRKDAAWQRRSPCCN